MGKLAEVKNIDISPYVTSFSSMPEEYTNGISKDIKDMGVSGLNKLWERQELDVVREKINSVYQQVGTKKNIIFF